MMIGGVSSETASGVIQAIRMDMGALRRTKNTSRRGMCARRRRRTAMPSAFSFVRTTVAAAILFTVCAVGG